MLFECLGTGGHFAQLGCELFPEIREIVLVCFVGTSSKESCFPPRPSRRAYTTVREFGAQEGSSPSTSTVAEPPVDATTHTSKPPRRCCVNTIHLLSCDHSGSVGFETPVEIRVGFPPVAGIL